ncbi:hypothetical protein OIU85_010494, partial [Salix viminalis]
TDDRGEDAPSRQKKNERRTPRRRKTMTEATSSSPTSEFLTVSSEGQDHVKSASRPAESE